MAVRESAGYDPGWRTLCPMRNNMGEGPWLKLLDHAGSVVIHGCLFLECYMQHLSRALSGVGDSLSGLLL